MDPLRSRVARTFDPDDVVGMQYDMMTRAMLVTATSSATVNLWEVPAGTWIEEVIVQVESAFDAGEIEVGIDSNLDQFIDANDFDPTGADAALSSRGSATADNPDGAYVAAGGTMKLTISGSATGGAVRIFVRYLLLDSIFGSSFGANWEFDAP